MEDAIKQILIEAGQKQINLSSETACQDLAAKIMHQLPDLNFLCELRDDLSNISLKLMHTHTGNVAHKRGTILSMINAMVRKYKLGSEQ